MNTITTHECYKDITPNRQLQTQYVHRAMNNRISEKTVGSQAPNQSTTSQHSFRQERNTYETCQNWQGLCKHKIDTSWIQDYSGEINVLSYNLKWLDLKSPKMYRRQTLTSVFIIRMDTTLQNIMHSFFFYNLFRSFVSAITG